MPQITNSTGRVRYCEDCGERMQPGDTHECPGSVQPAALLAVRSFFEVRNRLTALKATLRFQQTRPVSDSRTITVLMIEAAIDELEWVLGAHK